MCAITKQRLVCDVNYVCVHVLSKMAAGHFEDNTLPPFSLFYDL